MRVCSGNLKVGFLTPRSSSSYKNPVKKQAIRVAESLFGVVGRIVCPSDGKGSLVSYPEKIEQFFSQVEKMRHHHHYFIPKFISDFETNLFLAKQTPNKRDTTRATLLLLILVASTKHIADRAETQTAEQLVDSKTTKETVDKATETKTVE